MYSMTYAIFKDCGRAVKAEFEFESCVLCSFVRCGTSNQTEEKKAGKKTFLEHIRHIRGNLKIISFLFVL